MLALELPLALLSLVCGPGVCGGMMTGLEVDKGGPAHFEMDIHCI